MGARRTISKPAGSLTEREIELITCAFQSLKEKPNIDYEVMAVKAGLKGAKSARDSFGPLYNKMISEAAAAKKSSVSPKKRKSGEFASPEASLAESADPTNLLDALEAAGGDEDEDDEEVSTPVKKKAYPWETKVEGDDEATEEATSTKASETSPAKEEKKKKKDSPYKATATAWPATSTDDTTTDDTATDDATNNYGVMVVYKPASDAGEQGEETAADDTDT
ncbi:hypothetical protein Q7P37_007048 [Cladosporium fusiforme]